ncbi:MAG: glycosyltransferase [Bdellovibrionales bacterium]|nr:glycosyltransferase [Bdellovibrionales bacterium]
MSVAVVITTYNNPKSLELCVRSFQNQTYTDFEVFIADDGSKDETRDLVARLKKECSFQIYHYWQPDNGYQKAKINNKVFADITPEKHTIIICVDHDVIVHYRFVEDHYRAHERVYFAPFLFMGRRVDLSPELTAKITPENVLEFNHGLSGELVFSALKGQTQNVLRSVRLNTPRWLTHFLRRDRVYDLLGSNYSITTKIMHDVNGYNENFKSYWGEDGDLFVRVRNSGVKIDGQIGYAVQWHLYHKRLEETRDQVDNYRQLLKDIEYKRCKNGIVKD